VSPLPVVARVTRRPSLVHLSLRPPPEPMRAPPARFMLAGCGGGWRGTAARGLAPNVEAAASERKGNNTLGVPCWLLQSAESGGWGVGDGGMASLDSCSTPRATPSVPLFGTAKTIATVLPDPFPAVRAAGSHTRAATPQLPLAPPTRPALPTRPSRPHWPLSPPTRAQSPPLPPLPSRKPRARRRTQANLDVTTPKTHPTGYCASDRAAAQRDMQRMAAVPTGAAAAADAAPTRWRPAPPRARSLPTTHPPAPQCWQAPGGCRMVAFSRSGGGRGGYGAAASECRRGSGGADRVGARTKEIGER